MDKAKLRAWWFHKQGLDGSLQGASPREVLKQTGWSRSVGGANPYLAIFARCGASREQIDQDVKNCEIHELPAARGCTYVVPQEDFALALTVGQGFADEADATKAIKFLGHTEQAIQELCENVCEALEDGAQDPKALRAKLGDKVRSFGEEGKKRGLSTDLPIALGRLQSQGRIRRVPSNGRLDNQRYLYTVWRPSPLQNMGSDKSQAFVEFARKYFSWIGPATLKEFQWLSGLGVNASKEAVESAALAICEGSSLLLPQDKESFEEFQVPEAPQYALVGSLDNSTHLRLGLPSLIDEQDFSQTVPGEKSLHNLTGLSELTCHGIYDRGRLIGVWDFDVERSELVWKTWRSPDEELLRAIKRTEDFVRDQLGDARTFSLDSPESRKPRLAMMRG